MPRERRQGRQRSKGRRQQQQHWRHSRIRRHSGERGEGQSLARSIWNRSQSREGSVTNCGRQRKEISRERRQSRRRSKSRRGHSRIRSHSGERAVGQSLECPGRSRKQSQECAATNCKRRRREMTQERRRGRRRNKGHRRHSRIRGHSGERGGWQSLECEGRNRERSRGCVATNCGQRWTGKARERRRGRRRSVSRWQHSHWRHSPRRNQKVGLMAARGQNRNKTLQ